MVIGSLHLLLNVDLKSVRVPQEDQWQAPSTGVRGSSTPVAATRVVVVGQSGAVLNDGVNVLAPSVELELSEDSTGHGVLQCVGGCD
jgi:hypothetical protein